MTDKACEILNLVRTQKPLIHCITNPISINQCANAILAVGAKPIMAEHPKEVCEITASSDALMLNIGNITDARQRSVLLSMKTAEEKNIPVLLDVVGVACSKFRREYTLNLLNRFTPSVIKGNYSEIKALYDEGYSSLGVDAEPSIRADNILKVAIKLANNYKAVILATGEIDVITNGERAVFIRNGTPHLAAVTGTGCMLGSLCAAFMTNATPMEASVFACCYLGICGELSKTDKGSGSFMVNLMDRLSTLDGKEILKYSDIEEK
ncbi:MAG: hydroxyethylthiazole kinase [Ruminococcaceae bacterium]|nr:hydroxyethylthiazole kinase [Oscillospiraceae bacterium]